MADASAPPNQSLPPMRGPGTHRVHSSCDRCRSRKTKCIDPVPGPCRYCARTGATCQIATPRRKRPYYHVTEEEYQCSMRILEHFFPERELNLINLRALAKDVVDGKVTSPRHGQKYVPSISEDGTSIDEDSPGGIEAVVESVNDLHEPLGCMMKDSQGKYRYVGAHSEIPFNAAVVTMGSGRRNRDVIPHPRVGAYPPALPTPAPPVDNDPNDRFFLPRRELADFYISRFLEDVHCTYWFYSIETFLCRVDQTYSGEGPAESSSWMCSLYAIFAIGAANYEEPQGQSPLAAGSPAALDERTSADYIGLAKQLVPTVYDEADIDSIRALAILSIQLENLCSRTSSYLYMGASIQMAYSLGLHRDQMSEGASMEREQNRRIWWTLFIMDQEVASRGGSPTIIDERHTKITTPLPSEQVLYPGMHTPLTWLSTSVSLCRLKREIIQAVYTERAAHTVSFSTISSLLQRLQKWLQLIPPHLKHDVPVPPTHKRAVAVLHLHYWSCIIMLCRPFLLYLVLKHSTLASSKKIWFERMGKTCIDAAQKSIAILQQTAQDSTLSSLTAFDSTSLLRTVMIFILAYVHTKMPQYKTHIETGISLLRGMEQIGFTKMATEETPGRLLDLGISLDSKESNAGVLLDDDLIAQLWGNFDPQFMNSFQTQQSLDMTFDDSSSFDINSEILQFTNLDDSIIIDPSQVYSSFDFR